MHSEGGQKSSATWPSSASATGGRTSSGISTSSERWPRSATRTQPAEARCRQQYQNVTFFAGLQVGSGRSVDRRRGAGDAGHHALRDGEGGARSGQGRVRRKAAGHRRQARRGSRRARGGERQDPDGRAYPQVSPGHPEAAGADSERRAGQDQLPVFEPPEHRQDPDRREHPLELRAARHLGHAVAPERNAEPRVVPGRRVSEHGRGRRHAEPLRLPERRAGAHLRELAAPGQGAAAGRGRVREDGGVRRHRRTEAGALSAQSGVEEPRAHRGEGGRAKRWRSTTASRCARNASTFSTASRLEPRRSATAPRGCGSCACSMPASARLANGAVTLARSRAGADEAGAAVLRPRVRLRRRRGRSRRGHEDLAFLARHEGRADRTSAPTSDRTSTSTAARSSATTSRFRTTCRSTPASSSKTTCSSGRRAC